MYRALGAGAAKVYPQLRTNDGKPAPVIIDADSEVPYEHVIGVVNALKEVNIRKIEFVGNSKFNRYYGR